jgi:hypothetical protein
MRHSPAALASVALLLTAAPAFATVRTFNAVMNGAQEPTPSGGTGTATVTIDDVSGLTTVNGAFTGLTSAANNAHLHGLAAPGSPAPASSPSRSPQPPRERSRAARRSRAPTSRARSPA